MAKSTEAPIRAPQKVRSATSDPTPEEIQARAYELYLERNGAPGDPLEDWVRAERELREKNGTKPRKFNRAPKNHAA